MISTILFSILTFTTTFGIVKSKSNILFLPRLIFGWLIIVWSSINSSSLFPQSWTLSEPTSVGRLVKIEFFLYSINPYFYFISLILSKHHFGFRRRVSRWSFTWLNTKRRGVLSFSILFFNHHFIALQYFISPLWLCQASTTFTSQNKKDQQYILTRSLIYNGSRWRLYQKKPE